MKTIKMLCLTLCSVMLSFTITDAQERIMFSRPSFDYNDYSDSTNGLYYINKDGSGAPIHAANFLPVEIFGGQSLIFMVSKNGDLVGINGEGGDNPDYANGVRYVVNGKGVVIVDHFGYPLNRSMPLEESPISDSLYSIGWGASGEYLPLRGTKYTEFNSDYYSTYGLKLNTEHLLVASDNSVYSTAPIGGTFSQGYLYKWNGPKIRILYHFSKPTGYYPQGKLLEGADGYLYGVTRRGGAKDFGVIFKVKKDGTDYSVLHHFSKIDGQYPDRGLTQAADGTLYSLTPLGGSNNLGVVFKIKPDGTGFIKLHDIAFSKGTSHGYKQPLLLDNYGYVYGKFPAASGTIFRIKTDGTDMRIIYDENITIYNIQLVRSINPKYKLASPANGATNISTSYLFESDSVPCALQYSLELSVNSNFTSPTLTFHNTAPKFLVQGLLPSKKYYARIRTSLWQRPGPMTSFTTATHTMFSAVTTPANGATGIASPTITVTVKAVSGATSYTVELSASAYFDKEIITGITDNSHRTFRMHNIGSSTLYYARVKTDVTSGYGKITSFTTSPSTTLASEPELGDTSVEVFPNPSNGSFRLLNASHITNAKIEVLDLAGNVMETFNLSDGTTEFGYDLPKGIYIMKTVVHRAVYRKRLVKE